MTDVTVIVFRSALSRWRSFLRCLQTQWVPEQAPNPVSACTSPWLLLSFNQSLSTGWQLIWSDDQVESFTWRKRTLKQCLLFKKKKKRWLHSFLAISTGKHGLPVIIKFCLRLGTCHGIIIIWKCHLLKRISRSWILHFKYYRIIFFWLLNVKEQKKNLFYLKLNCSVYPVSLYAQHDFVWYIIIVLLNTLSAEPMCPYFLFICAWTTVLFPTVK